LTFGLSPHLVLADCGVRADRIEPVIATCSIPFSPPLACDRPAPILTAQENHHGRLARAAYPRAMLALNADGARFGVMARSHVGSASGTSIQKHADIRNLHKGSCPAESNFPWTLAE